MLSTLAQGYSVIPTDRSRCTRVPDEGLRTKSTIGWDDERSTAQEILGHAADRRRCPGPQRVRTAGS